MWEAGAGVRETQGAQGQLTSSKRPKEFVMKKGIAFTSKLFLLSKL
jgi:hypothetical protein